MDKRSAVIALFGIHAFALWPMAHGQSPAAPKRIGFLGSSNPAAGRAFLAAFDDELTRSGWVEGRNLVTTFRFAEGDPSRLSALAAELALSISMRSTRRPPLAHSRSSARPAPFRS
jgi:hypothetical protein